jgi:hypothetical protein
MIGIARILDRLVCSGIKEILERNWYLSPQVSQGQGNLYDCLKDGLNVNPIGFHFPFLNTIPLKEREWAVEAICRFYRAYFRALHICFPKLEVDVLNIDLSCGLYISDVGGLVRLLKDLCVAPLSYRFRSTDVFFNPFFGSGNRYLKTAVRRGNARSMLFCNTALQLKRCCPKVPSWFISSQLIKHQERMESTPRQSQAFISNVIRSLEPYLLEAKLYGSYDMDLDANVSNISSRATIEVPGYQGGGFSYYQHFEGDVDNNGNFRPVVRHWDVTDTGVVTYLAPMFPTQSMLLTELRDILSDGVPRRKVVGIEEPLKVRVITVGHACETNLWASFQKFTTKRLSRLPEITSGKASVSDDGVPSDFCSRDFDSMDRIFQLYTDLGYEPVVVSDDASAATDSVSPELSARVSDMIWKNTSPGRIESQSSWLGELEYPRGPAGVIQRNGQLMGDRRSFVTLNLLHLGATRAFLDSKGLGRGFVRINGDDKIVVLPRRYVEDYFAYMSELWEINLTKTYVDARYFSFNSKLWDRKNRVQVPILRFAMCDGIDKNGDKSADPRSWNRIKADCPPFARKEMFNFFNSCPVWRPILQRASKFEINWFLPEICGGLGLRTPEGDQARVTPLQRTMVLQTASEERDYKLKYASSKTWTSRPLTITYPQKVGDKSWSAKQEAPVPKQVKPDNGPLKIRFPKKPGFRSWRDCSDEIDALWETGRHFCRVGGCELCLQEVETKNQFLSHQAQVSNSEPLPPEF